MEEFAVIEGMVSDMLLGIRWEHKFNIHTSWMRSGNHYISIGKNNFVAGSTNKLKVHPIIKTKGKVTLKPESISFIEVQVPRDISGKKSINLTLTLTCQMELFLWTLYTHWRKLQEHYNYHF